MHPTKPVFQIATWLHESNVRPTPNILQGHLACGAQFHPPLDEALDLIVRHENFRFSTEGYVFDQMRHKLCFISKRHPPVTRVDADVREFHVFLKIPQRLRIDVETFHSMWLNSIESVKSFSFLHVVSELELASPPAAENDSLA
ncbi:hypothetical protein PsorP6_019074 [Peronosclerospora sorghi]|nr:hypothetical protein PsorP6_019074 [Peronosclerospora sorghi]